MRLGLRKKEVFMDGISISDKQGGRLTFGLVDILRLVGKRALSSQWKCLAVEAVGNSADQIHEISDSKAWISGDMLVSMASDLVQIIDGKFEAYSEHASKPWLIVSAIDGSEYDVETEDRSILDLFKASFSEVKDFPTEL